MDNFAVCLWFDGTAEEAARFYCQTFKDSHLGSIACYGESGENIPGRPDKGSVMTADFDLQGLKVIALNGGPAFSINPSASLFASFDSKDELDRVYHALSEGGMDLLPLQEYPFAPRYAWVQDKFGMSWQLILRPSVRRVVPCLLFAGHRAGEAADAIEFYTSEFPNSKIEHMDMYPPTAELPRAVKHASVLVRGQELRIMDAPNDCPFEFKPGVSFILYCKTQAEIDDLWHRLSAGGAEVQCGWVTDKFGVSWQVVPEQLRSWMQAGDSSRTEKVMGALLKMTKLDIALLQQAFES